jgi:hypothetical protein
MALIPLLTAIKRTIEQSLNCLPPWARDRLLELRRANPETLLSNLPPPVRTEVKQILSRALADTPAGISRQPASQQTLMHPTQPRGFAPNGHPNGQRSQPRFPDENALTVLGTDVKSGREVTISLKERFLGFYVIGVTGAGKSTFDLNLIHSDISHGFGVCLVEPHFDLTRQVIAAMPEARLKDVIYLDLTDATILLDLIFLRPKPARMTLRSPRLPVSSCMCLRRYGKLDRKHQD